MREGETGFLTPTRDPEALGQAMSRLMALAEAQRRSMGAMGREHVRTHYGLSRVVERWEAVYHEVLTRKGLSVRSQRPAGLNRDMTT